jgi:hypothetical protein
VLTYAMQYPCADFIPLFASKGYIIKLPASRQEPSARIQNSHEERIMIFTCIKNIDIPTTLEVATGFEVKMYTDGIVPFPQLIIYQEGDWQWLVNHKQVSHKKKGEYIFKVPAHAYHAGRAWLKIEGCRRADIENAVPEDWIGQQCEVFIHQVTKENSPTHLTTPLPSVTLGVSHEPMIYFGIHKHMHQPYYNATDPEYWDGEKDDIFATRQGPYTHFIPAAIEQYVHAGLPHAGLSSSWSGSLVEQLCRCMRMDRARGVFCGWYERLRTSARAQTAFGNPRLEFTAFGMFHPLMPLIPARDIVGQILWHRDMIHDTFGVEAGDMLFPPETAFAPHMIPALKQAGINSVIFDSLHLYRACQNYPYAGASEGMLPPNRADQVNPALNDWLQLHTIWAPGKVSPSLLKPCYLTYSDRHGKEHDIIGIPAERYLGNEDARGGYGALQYENVMGQLLEQIVATQSYDPKHPPFFLLHSDGDNHGGGAESYYTSNTGRLVEMCRSDRRFQLITLRDYLQQFPLDPKQRFHVEAGSWAGADNGDAQFSKWFSRADQEYSPDLNSWAVLTAFQNLVHTLEDSAVDNNLVNELKRLLYMAETSCYWYWTGQEVWDVQVTHAAKKGAQIAAHISVKDKTGPTIFQPWIRPANPGGQDWGQGGLMAAAKEATLKTLVYDVSGVRQVNLYYREYDAKTWIKVPMRDLGPYPSRTKPAAIAHCYQVILPPGSGNIRYYVEAEDNQGNRAETALARIFIA